MSSRYGLGVSAQRSTADPDARRSAFPQFAGVPSVAAVLIAVTATLLGIGIEAGVGHRELGITFAVFYVLGCVGAVLAVRQSAIFTAVIQPPLLLFVSVPLAYFMFHGDEVSGLKGFLITCGYPLIERFPLMLFATATVLALGLARRFLQAPDLGGLAARFARPAGRAPREAEHRPRHAARPPRPRRDERDPAPQQRRRRPATEAPPAERRRQRPAQESRRAPREPRERREGYAPRPGYQPRRGYEPREDYPPRRYAPREDYRGYPPRNPRPEPAPRRDDYHPVSRVRYRGEDPRGS